MGRDLAKKLGVTPTLPAGDSSAKRQAEVMATLRAKHGADFDRAAAQRLERQVHETGPTAAK